MDKLRLTRSKGQDTYDEDLINVKSCYLFLTFTATRLLI